MKSMPFAIDELETLKEQETLEVDMSKPNFPENLDPIKTSFIYMRNIGFHNLKPDFSGLSKEDRFKYLEEYISTNIDISDYCTPLIYTWATIFIDQYKKDDLNILSRQETEEFVETHKDLINQVRQFIVSLPVYAMYRFNHENMYTLEDITHSDFDGFGPNLYTVLKYMDLAYLIISNQATLGDKPPVFYDKYFTVENNQLMEVIENTPMMAALNALATSEDNICKQILDKGDKLDDGLCNNEVCD